MEVALPVELWTDIVQHLPPSQRRRMLRVSRILHDIALRFVFRVVKIYFMHGEPGFVMLNTENERYVRETADYLLHRSWEILHRIISEPCFASVVKVLSVHAFTDGPAVFEYSALAQALQSLPHLQSFHWFGDCPDFSTVAEHLPKKLQYLRIQSSVSLTTSLGHLDKLNFFQPAIPFIYVRDQKLDGIFTEWDCGSSSGSQDLVDIVEKNPIQQLALLSAHVGLMPIRVCNSLTVLDICVPLFGDLVGIDLLFRHALFLESLSLVGYIEPDLFADLPKDPTVLPRLSSFRLSCEFWDVETTEMHVPLLSEFLSKRPSLRRLYIRLPAARLHVTLALATVIGKLESLRVLGFHAGYEPLDEDTALQLADQLSVNLEALQLALPWNRDLHVRTWYPFLHKLQQTPGLSFLHLFSGEDPVPISPVELATDLEHLQLIGIQRSLWTVEREKNEELEPMLWPPWSVKYCIPEDFPCADHAWLFRYH
ncbi:hypothetical protein C8J57DRAFT_1048758 [Mycena rebaudengoi]|nr:hypothetical protein C8J57DRAFT_1048758 [Mycena rebaudengoi]